MTVQTFTIPEDTLHEQAAKDGITHLSTGIAVIRNDKLLVVRREASDYLGGSYELPGGGVDNGETLTASVARELREETGLTLTRVLGMFHGFDYTTPNKPHARQLNFVVEANGAVKLSVEHDAFTWIAFEDNASLSLAEEVKTCVTDALRLAAGRGEYYDRA